MSIENFFALYPHTISALGALATFMAAIVALWLARLQGKPKLRIIVDRQSKITPDIDGSYDTQRTENIIAVMINNVGLLPVSISDRAFHWRLPLSFWHKKHAQKCPSVLFNEIIIYPSKSINIELENDETRLFKELLELCNLSRLPRCFIRHISLVVICGGFTFKAKIGKDLKRMLKEQLA